MTRVRLGTLGTDVASVGLGCGSMSGPALGAGPDDATSANVVRAAVEAGMTLLDTADFYGLGHNETLLASALAGVDRDAYVVSDKFGGLRDPAGRFVGADARPETVKSALGFSLQRLGTDHIDVYRPARLDPDVPIEETVGALAECVEAGWIRAIGLSEVGADTVRRAHAVHPISDVQIEYALVERKPEDAILPTCRELGIGVTAYGVLSHGLLTGRLGADDTDAPGHLPRLKGENRATNLALVENLRPIAERLDVSIARLTLAWALTKGSRLAGEGGFVAIVGASRPERVADNLAAADLELSADDLAEIERAVPREQVAGTRYATPLMAMLDSEK